MFVQKHSIALAPQAIGHAIYNGHQRLFMVADHRAGSRDRACAGVVDAGAPTAAPVVQSAAGTFWLGRF